MRRSLRMAAAASTAALALLAAACSSSSGSGSSSSSSSSGRPVAGGTATLALQPGVTPNYIFPMLTGAYYKIGRAHV